MSHYAYKTTAIAYVSSNWGAILRHDRILRNTIEWMLLIFTMVSASCSVLCCNFFMTMVYLLSKHNIRLKLKNLKNAYADAKKHYAYKKRV